jgi:hypothetical protein
VFDPLSAVWAQVKRHRGWYFLAFLMGGLPIGFATVWPTLTHETVPEWLVKRGWPDLTTLLGGWLAVAFVVILVIIVQATHRRKTHAINDRSINGHRSSTGISSVQLAEAESEWRKLDESQKQLLGRIYVTGELSWNQIDEDYKNTRPIYADPFIFDYLLERSTLLDCANPTSLIGLRHSNKPNYFANPVWNIKPELRAAVGELLARPHGDNQLKEDQLTSRSIRGSNKRSSLRGSLGAVALNVAQLKVHRLLAFWIQLILISSVFTVIAGTIVGGALVLSVVLAFPLCLVLSRLVNRSFFLSVVVGAIVVGILEGGFAYSIRDWGIRGGMIFGGFYGASFTSYFSSKNKYLELFWVAICALGLVGALLTVHCSGSIVECVRFIGEDIDLAVRGAIIPIILGLGFAPVIGTLSRLMESLMDRILELFPS